MSELKSKQSILTTLSQVVQYLLVKAIVAISSPIIQFEHMRQVTATSPLFTTVETRATEVDDTASSRWEKRLVQPVKFRKLTFRHHLAIVAVPLAVSALMVAVVAYWLI